MDLRKSKLDPDEAEYVRKLREDSDTWSVPTLAKLFNVKKRAISLAAPPDESRRKKAEEEDQLLAKMKPYKRKRYLLERQANREKRLQQALAEAKYKFPNEEFLQDLVQKVQMQQQQQQ